MSLEAVRCVFGGVPLSSRIMCVRRDSGVKTLARMQARQLDLLVSVQTTLLAARRVQAQRCQTTERSQFLLVGIGMLKNTYGKWHLSGGMAPAAEPIDGPPTTGRRPRYRGARASHPRALI